MFVAVFVSRCSLWLPLILLALLLSEHLARRRELQILPLYSWVVIITNLTTLHFASFLALPTHTFSPAPRLGCLQGASNTITDGGVVARRQNAKPHHLPQEDGDLKKTIAFQSGLEGLVLLSSNQAASQSSYVTGS